VGAAAPMLTYIRAYALLASDSALQHSQTCSQTSVCIFNTVTNSTPDCDPLYWWVVFLKLKGSSIKDFRIKSWKINHPLSEKCPYWTTPPPPRVRTSFMDGPFLLFHYRFPTVPGEKYLAPWTIFLVPSSKFLTFFCHF